MGNQSNRADHRSGSQPYFYAFEQAFYKLRAFSNFARAFAQNPSFAELYRFSVLVVEMGRIELPSDSEEPKASPGAVCSSLFLAPALSQTRC